MSFEDMATRIDRRELLKYLGVGGAAALAGCSGTDSGDGGGGTADGGGSGDGGGGNGDGGNGGGGSGDGSSGDGGSGMSDFQSALSGLGWGDNPDRRMTTLDEWPIEARQQIPDNPTEGVEPWLNSGAIADSPYEPVPGWEDSIASEVDSIQILNFGSLEFDPATLATYALFEDRYGIEVDPLAIPVDQAIPREAAFLSSGSPEPVGFGIVLSDTLTTFVADDYLEPLSGMWPDESMWDPYQPLMRQSFGFNDETYVGPNTLEGSLVHARPDLMREQGIDDSVISAIADGSYTWDDIETVMEAFEGTDVYGWAYRGASRVYTYRDWKKMFYQAGGSIVEDDGTVRFNSEPALFALEKMIEYLDNGWVPESVVNFGQGDLADGFLSGQFAMVPVFGDLVPRALDQFERDTQYVPTVSPEGWSDAPNPTRAGIASPNGVGINVNAPPEKKLAATLYLDARLSYTNAWYEYTFEGNQSYVQQVYEDAAQTDAAAYSAIRGRAMSLNKVELFPQARALKERVSQELQAAIAGQKEPQAALDAAQSFTDTVLGQ
jgi:multiple sugar transport system substrate-binding protein